MKENMRPIVLNILAVVILLIVGTVVSCLWKFFKISPQYDLIFYLIVSLLGTLCVIGMIRRFNAIEKNISKRKM